MCLNVFFLLYIAANSQVLYTILTIILLLPHVARACLNSHGGIICSPAVPPVRFKL